MGDIQDYIQDEQLQNNMEIYQHQEKNRERIETRTAYVTTDVTWLPQKNEWNSLVSIGAIHTQFQTDEKKTSEWHYYISSRPLTARELLHHARMEWAVESIHWLLDVHYGEDYLRVVNPTIQENINHLRKFALNLLKQFKKNTASKRPLSKLMFDCLLDFNVISRILLQN